MINEIMECFLQFLTLIRHHSNSRMFHLLDMVIHKIYKLRRWARKGSNCHGIHNHLKQYCFQPSMCSSQVEHAVMLSSKLYLIEFKQRQTVRICAHKRHPFQPKIIVKCLLKGDYNCTVFVCIWHLLKRLPSWKGIIVKLFPEN